MYSTGDDRDLLDLYIEELRGEPVLTAQQQKELARAMRRATNNEAREQARSELIRANLRFRLLGGQAVSEPRCSRWATSSARRTPGWCGRPTSMIPDVGVNFISYAVWWIRQALHSAVQRQGRTVQVPLNRAADLSRVSRAGSAAPEALA
jgi:RNA polymerase primary sigma factor